MICYRFPVIFAACVTCAGFAPNYNRSSEQELGILNWLPSLPVLEKLDRTEIADRFKTVIIADSSAYDRYMQAGYEASNNRDYQSAIENFRQALSLRPKDVYAERAIRNLESYAYDGYMQAGYQADKNRDYQTALENFEKAVAIRPDAFHAQQAVRNVEKYIASNNNQQTNTPEPTNYQQGSLLWLVLGIVAIALIASGVIISLLRTFDRGEAKKQTKDSSPPPTQIQEVNSEENSSHSENHLSSPSVSNGTSISNQIKTEEPKDNSSLIIPSSSASISKLDIIAELIKDLHQPDPAARRKAIWELAQRSDSRAMKPLVELMIDADSQERSLILEAITQIASRTLKPMNKALSISLEDENANVRKNAIRDLTRVYELMSQVTQRLSHVADDPDAEVRETAKWALKQLSQMQKIPNWEEWEMKQNTLDGSNHKNNQSSEIEN